jgi:hypothetical protein
MVSKPCNVFIKKRGILNVSKTSWIGERERKSKKEFGKTKNEPFQHHRLVQWRLGRNETLHVSLLQRK